MMPVRQKLDLGQSGIIKLCDQYGALQRSRPSPNDSQWRTVERN